MTRLSQAGWSGILLASLAQPAGAQSAPIEDPRAQEIAQTSSFLASHPDLRYRKLAQEAVAGGRLEAARTYFRYGARYADKLSQAALAEMWWDGQGGEQDRALAYAWMDLAAERGTPFLLAVRERYWAALDPAERQRALREGPALYAEYGDPAAQPRLERELRGALRQVTGSRTGRVGGGMEMEVRIAGGLRARVDPDVYYRDDFWKPADYWQRQARELEHAGRGEGKIDVGLPTTVRPEN
ncbi:MAG: SEL1-like repeat protein [Stenotrophomonas maltophilia]